MPFVFAKYLSDNKIKNIEKARKMIDEICETEYDINMSVLKLADTEIPVSFIRSASSTDGFQNKIEELFTEKNADKILETGMSLFRDRLFSYKEIKEISENNYDIDYINLVVEHGQKENVFLILNSNISKKEFLLFEHYAKMFKRRNAYEDYFTKKNKDVDYLVNCLDIAVRCEVYLSFRDIFIYKTTGASLKDVREVCWKVRANN